MNKFHRFAKGRTLAIMFRGIGTMLRQPVEGVSSGTIQFTEPLCRTES